jgi:AcrR family transcriptional regulator
VDDQVKRRGRGLRTRATTSAEPQKKKQTRNPQRTSAAILAAATREFTERGYGGARIDEIAARARINKRMLYHYYGGKEALYRAVLESAYVGIRSAEAELDLESRDPAEAMRHLARFTWNYFLKHPEFLSILNTENLLRGKYIKTSPKIIALHSPMISLLGDTLRRGVEIGEFRDGVDAVDLYISIAALGFFYLSNRWTLSTIFRRDLVAPKALEHWGDHIVEVIMSYLRASDRTNTRGRDGRSRRTITSGAP